MSHIISPAEIAALPRYTPERPLRLMVSACIAGDPCGVDGTSYGEYPLIRSLMDLPNVSPVWFCPENFSFGTPRAMPDITGGNGYDVLDGSARVFAHTGEDWTDGFVAAAHQMLGIAIEARVEIAILQDMSAACGVQVISDGCRLVAERKFRKGPGVCTALLLRRGIKVLSERDYRALDLLRAALDPDHVLDESAIDYHESVWFRDQFGRS